MAAQLKKTKKRKKIEKQPFTRLADLPHFIAKPHPGIQQSCAIQIQSVLFSKREFILILCVIATFNRIRNMGRHHGRSPEVKTVTAKERIF